MKKYLIGLVFLGNAQLTQAFLIDDDLGSSAAGLHSALADDTFAYEELSNTCSSGLADRMLQGTSNMVGSCGGSAASVFDTNTGGSVGNSGARNSSSNSSDQQTNPIVQGFLGGSQNQNTNTTSQVNQTSAAQQANPIVRGFLGGSQNQNTRTTPQAGQATAVQQANPIVRGFLGGSQDQNTNSQQAPSLFGNTIQRSTDNLSATVVDSSPLVRISAVNTLSVITPAGTTSPGATSGGITNVSVPSSLVLVGLGLLILGFKSKQSSTLIVNEQQLKANYLRAI
jgi:hypothetical protein